MDIKPEEVKEIRVIGRLYGDDVKLVTTFGGFVVAIGRKERGSNKSEALAGGSHVALVDFQLSKRFKDSYEPVLAKSESEQLAKIEDCSNFLPQNLQDHGLGLYILSKSNDLTFIVDKFGVTLGEYKTENCNNQLVIKNHRFNQELRKQNGAIESLAKAMDYKMRELNLKKVVKG